MPVTDTFHPLYRLWVARHGETEWSRAGRHTGRTDVPLTPAGEAQARALGRLLRGHHFAQVVCSPLKRASDTCRLAGFSDEQVRFDDALLEWDYGRYEGRTTAEIRRERPGWTIWTGEIPAGEGLDNVQSRVDHFLETLRGQQQGDTLLFAHGHLLRVLAARFLGLDAACGRLFMLSAASLGILGHEHDMPAIVGWNLNGPVD